MFELKPQVCVFYILKSGWHKLLKIQVSPINFRDYLFTNFMKKVFFLIDMVTSTTTIYNY